MNQKYDPQYCHDLIAWIKDGNAFCTYCYELGVSLQTLYNWAERHPEFARAKAKAKEIRAKMLYERQYSQ